MPIKHCSITGADNEVDPRDLIAVSDAAPSFDKAGESFVRWAILYDPTRLGEPRFPDREWMDDFLQAGKKAALHAPASLHLCGEGLLRFIDGEGDTLGLMRQFDDIQLNVKYRNVKFNVQELAEAMAAQENMRFIVQYTPEADGLLKEIERCGGARPDLLFDGSAGAGELPASWPAYKEGYICGYAGGLSPDNLAQNLPLITKAAGQNPLWIDTETRMRDIIKERGIDRFNLNKVQQFINNTYTYEKTQRLAMQTGMNPAQPAP